MTSPNLPTDPADDELSEALTAYLDGELPYEQQLAIEARINSDPAVRRELEKLRRAWEMLDYLPRKEPSPDFTQRTISQLTLIPLSQSTPVATRRFALPPLIGWLALWLVMVVAGYGLTALADYQLKLFHPRLDLEAELPSERSIAEHLRIYRHIDDLDFARQLDRPELFGDETIY
jgi:anti-sigma factor RsiW